MRFHAEIQPIGPVSSSVGPEPLGVQVTNPPGVLSECSNRKDTANRPKMKCTFNTRIKCGSSNFIRSQHLTAQHRNHGPPLVTSG